MLQVSRGAILPTRAWESQPHIHGWLADAERQIQDALAQAQASIRSSQQALAAIAELRSRIESDPGGVQSTFLPGSFGIPGGRTGGEIGFEISALREPRWLTLASAPEDVPADRLSPREIEVLVLIADGRSNKAIAHELYLSVRTVERHINNIYRKIGAQNRADATAYALRRHLA